MVEELILTDRFLDLSIGAKLLYFYILHSSPTTSNFVTQKVKACMYLTDTTENEIEELVQIGLLEKLPYGFKSVIVRTDYE